MDLDKARQEIANLIDYCKDRQLASITIHDIFGKLVVTYLGTDATNFIVAIETLSGENERIELRKAVRELTQAIKDLRHNIPTRLGLYTEERK